MKKSVQVQARANMISGTAGAKIQYAHDIALCEIFGQAKTILLQAYGHRITGANTKLTVEVWHTCLPTGRPLEVGKLLTTATFTVGALRPPIATVSGPLAGRVELVVGIEDNAAMALQEYDFELWSTLILEE